MIICSENWNELDFHMKTWRTFPDCQEKDEFVTSHIQKRLEVYDLTRDHQNHV